MADIHFDKHEARKRARVTADAIVSLVKSSTSLIVDGRLGEAAECAKHAAGLTTVYRWLLVELDAAETDEHKACRASA